ncbi:MAG: hypothetical protein IKM77_00935 [Prevotella sp.]|nr:hypothetical protein [Prevotella sp.]
MNNIDNIEQRIKNASPLDLPQTLLDIELYNQETAQDLFDKVHAEFEKEDIIDNVVTPVFTSIIDGFLAHPKFKGLASKSGLSAQKVMKECKEFNYDGKVIYMMPDAFVEHRNEVDKEISWGQENRSQYIRESFSNLSAMGRYKMSKVKENGSKKNLLDEYTKEKNITAKKDNPDFRRDDPKNLHNAETDHIIPLHTIFTQLQNNCGLSDGDIKRIANQDANFALTSRLINNSKRKMSNTEFIAKQDELKKEGKPYVELSPEVRENMIKMEKDAQKAINKSVNKTVSNNLLGKGQADRQERKEAMAKRKAELGRKLTAEERAEVDKKMATKKAMTIHMGNAKQAGKQSLMYAIGTAILFVFKPLYYEIKDGMIFGFKEGVCADTYKQAFAIRFARIKDYVWDQIKNLKSYLGSAMDMLKNFLSALIEGLIGMFVGIFKKIFKVLKEGTKIFVQAWPVLFGEQSKTMTTAQKGDAILKLVGGSVCALCGIGIDMMLEKLQFIPEDFRSVFSVILSGLASVLVFYALDKADLFNVKKERRENRIKEVFEERIKEIQEATGTFNEVVIETIRKQRLEFSEITNQLKDAISSNDYKAINVALQKQAAFLGVQLDVVDVKDRNNIKWDL